MTFALASVSRVVAVLAVGIALTAPTVDNRVYEQTSLTMKQQLALEYTAAFQSLKR